MKPIIFSKLTCLLLACVMLLLAGATTAQNRHTVVGKITDASGAPIIGATVVETGTTNGVTSGVDGSYQITVKNNKGSLTFSSLGYSTQDVSVGAKNTIHVKLEEDAINMSEVIVTGYGRTVTKDKLTAAISKVSGDILEKGVRSNALHALAGTVTGVRVSSTSGQPGAAPNIVIRGGAALNGSGKPLYVVDGVQKDDMNDINSNDIESMEILKDAAATALYGAKANAGVVLVTTKSGRTGKAEVAFKVNYGLNYIRHTFDFLEADDYLYYLRRASYNAGNLAALSAAYPFGTGNDYYADGNKRAEGVYSTMFLTKDNAFLLNQGYKQMIDPITGKTIIYSAFKSSDDSIREVAATQDYNVSISGGNEKGKYYASLGYYDEGGFPVMSMYNRLSFTTNGSYKITPWLTSNSAFSFTKSESRDLEDYRSSGEEEFFGIMFSSPPVMRRTNLDGDLIVCTTAYQHGNWSVLQDKFYRRNTNYRFTMNQGLKVSLTDHLSVKINGIWYFNMYERESANKAFQSKVGVIDALRKTSANYNRYLSQTYNAIAAYENSWNNHNLSITGGFEFYDKYRFGLSAGGQGADSDDFISLGYISKIGDKNIEALSMNSVHSRERSMSVFANASYDYKSKYLVSFSMRYDGYSKLVNNKWGFFPGISAAWNIHKEKFMDLSSNWLSSLKLRAGYGQNGNVNIVSGPYDLQGMYGKSGTYDTEYGLGLTQLPYPDLRWEKTTSIDVALEAAFWNRLRISVGGYRKLTSNLLATVPFPTTAGVDAQKTNNGSVRNSGLEIEIDAMIYQDKNWKVHMGFNTTYMRSKIVSLPHNGNERNRQGGIQVYHPQTGELIWVGGYQEGQEYGDAYSTRMLDIVRSDADLQNYAWYVDKWPATPKYGPAVWNTLTPEEQQKGTMLKPGDAIFYDVNGDGVVDNYDRVKMGNTIPKWLGGFNFSVDWRGLSLFARFDFAGNYVAYNSRKQSLMSLAQGTFNTIEEAKDTWSEERPNAKWPILTPADQQSRVNFRQSQMFYENQSYLCAREISLSYTLPRNWAKAMAMQNLSFTVSGQNLFYWTATSIYNPEYGANTKSGYPTPRTVLFGVKAIF